MSIFVADYSINDFLIIVTSVTKQSISVKIQSLLNQYLDIIYTYNTKEFYE